MSKKKQSHFSVSGPLLVVFSSICFGTGGVLMKYIPWNSLAVNSARSILGLLLIIPYLKLTKHKITVNRPIIIGALCIAATNTLFVIANKLTTAGNAVILQFTAPVFAMIFSAILFKIRATSTDRIVCLAVFAGVICFFIDGFSAGNLSGNIVAVCSGATYSGVFLMNTSENSDSFSSTVIGFSLNALIGLPSLLMTDFSGSLPQAWICIVLLGIVDIGLAYIFLAKGLKTTGAVTASLISGIEPVLNPLLVALIYHENLTPLSLAGAAIVFVTIILYNVYTAKKQN